MSNKYFCCSDIHGFYTIFKTSLEEKGFDINNKDHILIICGDLFDRGSEAKELLDFLSSIPKDRLLLIKGNHEDLLEDCLFQLENHINISSHHWRNGTLDTIAQLTDINKYDLVCGVYNFKDIKRKMKYYFKLVSQTVDYYEVGDYIFVHGWIPPTTEDIYYKYNINWRDASKKEWEKARWFNGMDMAHNNIIEENKTIVCGHWHTGYGHYYIHHEGESQYDSFEIYKDKGIIALDACTAYSNKINILVIDENEKMLKVSKDILNKHKKAFKKLTD